MTSTKKIIGIVGSYRKEGHVDAVVSAVLKAAAEAGAQTRKVYLVEQTIRFCTNCRSCMQSPGATRGSCVLEDAMEGLLQDIEDADGLVIGAPVNFGDVNAITRRFLERCVGFAYWPWEMRAPKLRTEATPRRAVLVTASAAPAWMARLFFNVVRTLKTLARLLGARPIGVLWLGIAGGREVVLPPSIETRAQRLGRRLAAP
jgi:hypothetical protein